jgi:hypothetical protein
MHTTRKPGDVGNETGFHLGTGDTTRKNTKVRLLVKGKSKRLSVGRWCAAPERPAAIQPNPLKFSKGRKWLNSVFFSDQQTTWTESQGETGVRSTLKVMDL